MTHTEIDRLKTLNIDIARWEQQRDPAAIRELDRVLSAQLVFRRADGSVVGKNEFMQALQKPSPFSERQSVDAAVTIAGDRALATLYVLGTKPDGTVGRYRNVRAFFRNGDDWTLEIWFNDDVARPI